MRKHMAIAIDGPSGSGKSTLAKRLASHFGFLYVDTGALYRAVGLHAIRQGISKDDVKAVEDMLADLSVTLELHDSVSTPLLNGEDVTSLIRTSEVAAYASSLSAMPAVRAFLLDLQKRIADSASVVMDGRDIGAVIIPDAQVKIFLTASDSDRAERRYAELSAAGSTETLDEVLEKMKQRDYGDKNRAIAPAVPAADAVILDNTGFTRDQTFERALEIVRSRAVPECIDL